DDEGVPAQNVTLVKNGILSSFLVSRTPVPSSQHSNGHGRCSAGYRPESRMANLMVESSKVVPEDALRKELIDEAKKQNKPYAILIENVEAGVTGTSSYTPQLFQVRPTVVKRVYTDGRPDELIRGARIVGTPLSVLQRIVETSDQTQVFNGY